MSTTGTQVLYISYDGMLEPLGESQVVSYLTRLATDFEISLLSFEKPMDLSDRARVTEMEQRLRASGISWIRLRYHKSPAVFSTIFDIARGIRRARRACRDRTIRIVHARGYVPALVALFAHRASAARFLFDMRGFWLDEKVEAGHWRVNGLLYRMGKRWERRFFRSADAIVSLTAAGVQALPTLGYDIPVTVPVEVIPTCVDLQRFKPAEKDPELVARLGLDNKLTVGCVGTISNWYMRHEMLRCLAYLSRSLEALRVLMVTREDPVALRRDAVTCGVPHAALVITQATFSEMPRYTSLFDAGLFFIRPALSKRASAATKLAEFLACGVPVIINRGVGDSGAIVGHYEVGVVLSALDEEAFMRSLPHVQALLGDTAVRGRCRETARELFDIEKGTDRYRALYKQLDPGEPMGSLLS
jgi:glycosyltransferase involved in cell wall biosynthesis